MGVILITPQEIFFDSFYRVFRFFERIFTDFITKIYTGTHNYLFYMAFLPFVLMFVFDLVMSFIFSIKHRELKFFNVFSPKSWRIIGEQKNFPREVSIKHTRLSPLAIGLLRYKSYKNARSGDIIRSKDGFKSTYLGSGLHNGEQVFVYKTSNGFIFSTLRPYEWSKALGSQRNDSTVRVVNKNNR